MPFNRRHFYYLQCWQVLLEGAFQFLCTSTYVWNISVAIFIAILYDNVKMYCKPILVMKIGFSLFSFSHREKLRRENPVWPCTGPSTGLQCDRILLQNYFDPSWIPGASFSSFQKSFLAGTNAVLKTLSEQGVTRTSVFNFFTMKWNIFKRR